MFLKICTFFIINRTFIENSYFLIAYTFLHTTIHGIIKYQPLKFIIDNVIKKKRFLRVFLFLKNAHLLKNVST